MSSFSWLWWEETSLISYLIGSMGLVYLPTFSWFLWCYVGEDASRMDPTGTKGQPEMDTIALSANNVVSTETSATEKEFGFVSIVFHSNQIATKPHVFGLREQSFLKAKFSDTTASIIQKPEEHQSIWNISLDIQTPKLRRWHCGIWTPKTHLNYHTSGGIYLDVFHLFIYILFLHHVFPKNISHLWTSKHGKALKTWDYITPKNEGNVGNPHPSFVGLAWPTGLTTWGLLVPCCLPHLRDAPNALKHLYRQSVPDDQQYSEWAGYLEAPLFC